MGASKELAEAHGVVRGAKKLAAFNNDLKAAEVYGEPTRAQVEAWLKLRNEVAHGRGEAVSVERIENTIAGVWVFLQDHPIESEGAVSALELIVALVRALPWPVVVLVAVLIQVGARP